MLRTLCRPALLLACVALLGAACGPVGPFSGGRLSGEEVPLPEPMPDLADLEQAQLETRPEDPHSINIWIVEVEGRAFLSSSLLMGPDAPDERTWVQHVEADPRVRLRLGDAVHPARLVRVEDEALRARVLGAFEAKYDITPERKAGAWVYRVEPR